MVSKRNIRFLLFIDAEERRTFFMLFMLSKIGRTHFVYSWYVRTLVVFIHAMRGRKFLFIHTKK